jgi:hypothetical protein
MKDGNDTEVNVAVAALCIGIAFAIGTAVVSARLRALASTSAGCVVMTRVAVQDRASILPPIPTASPPAILRV